MEEIHITKVNNSKLDNILKNKIKYLLAVINLWDWNS
jgi:hypothetical protein